MACPTVEVWSLDALALAGEVQRFKSHLAVDEVARAERYIRQVDHDQFAIFRGALREILAHKLRQRPSEIAFATTELGKPFLAGESHDPSRSSTASHTCEMVRFNVSHSLHRAVIALTNDIEVGIDLETASRLNDSDSLAKYCLTPAELAFYFSHPPTERRLIMLRFWSLKEAYLKATGKGLSIPLRQVEIRGPQHTAIPSPISALPSSPSVADVASVWNPPIDPSNPDTYFSPANIFKSPSVDRYHQKADNQMSVYRLAPELVQPYDPDAPINSAELGQLVKRLLKQSVFFPDTLGQPDDSSNPDEVQQLDHLWIQTLHHDHRYSISLAMDLGNGHLSDDPVDMRTFQIDWQDGSSMLLGSRAKPNLELIHSFR